VGGTITSFFAIIVVKALGLLESVAVGRILGDIQFGQLALVLSVTNLVLAMGTIGVPPALTKFLSGEASSREAARGTILRALQAVIVASVSVGIASGVIVLTLLAPSYPSGGLEFLFALGILLVTISAPLSLFGNALQGLGLVTALNLRTVLASGVGLALAVSLALSFGAPGALVAFFAGTALTGVFAIRAVWARVSALDASLDRQPVSLRSILNYGLPTLLSGLTVLFGIYWINSTMAVGRGFADLGAFAVALTLANVIALIPGAVAVPLVPVLSSLSVSDPERGRMVLPRVMRIVIFITVPIVLVAIGLAPEIISVTYGPGYIEGAPYLSILALSALLTAVVGVVGNHIAASGKMWWSLAINSVWTGTVVLASSVLVPRIGGVGASSALFAGYSILAIVAFGVGRLVMGIEFGDLARPAFWAASLVALALLVAYFAAEWKMLAVMALLIVALTSLVFMLSPSERALVRQLWSIFVTRKLIRDRP
jgi:O-antigen/teichoic acid export membrane protein